MLTDRELLKINIQNELQPLSPFINESKGSPSYGLSSHGYDIRLADEWWLSEEYFINKEKLPIVLDPTSLFFRQDVQNCFKYYKQPEFILQPHEFVLAASFETFDLPDNLAMEIKDKSSLARLGLQVFNTVGEAGWSGVLTIEIYNNSCNAVKLHHGMGIAQAVFHRLENRPLTTYADRKGKYQGQGMGTNKVTLAR